ncbi:MAG: NnrU family protein [Pseudomonadota bacterium]
MSVTPLVFAALLLFFTHLGPSVFGIRDPLVRQYGVRTYRAAFVMLALLSLLLLILLYGDVQRSQYLWYPSPQLYRVPEFVMPVACVLVAGGLLKRRGLAEPELVGIHQISRHPVLWGVVLFALSHLAANGDHASVVLFASIALLAGIGTLTLDAKSRRSAPGAHQQMLATTSNLPFVALLFGRTGFRPRGLLGPLLAGAVLCAVLWISHRWLAGVSLA